MAYDSTLITGGTTAQSLVEAAYDKKKKIRMKTKGMGKGASLGAHSLNTCRHANVLHHRCVSFIYSFRRPGVAPDEEKLWSSAMIMVWSKTLTRGPGCCAPVGVVSLAEVAVLHFHRRSR